MQHQPEYFSVFGSGYAAERQRGMQEFGNSFAWRPVAKMWAVTALVMTLGAAVTHVVNQAHAGANSFLSTPRTRQPASSLVIELVRRRYVPIVRQRLAVLPLPVFTMWQVERLQRAYVDPDSTRRQREREDRPVGGGDRIEITPTVRGRLPNSSAHASWRAKRPNVRPEARRSAGVELVALGGQRTNTGPRRSGAPPLYAWELRTSWRFLKRLWCEQFDAPFSMVTSSRRTC